MTPQELTRRRKRLALTQAQLAEKLGVDPMTLSRWERGLHRIPEPVAQLVKLLATQRGGKRRKT
jgi:transcriptional regulator with XRE-family HTH domain